MGLHHLGGLGGRSPPKIWGGGRPMHPPPPIFWEVLLWDVRKSTKWLRKGVKKEYFCLKLRFLVKKREVIYVIHQISDKIESKKWREKFWAVKWKFFPKKGSFKNFCPPQSRRQVSANDWKPCYLIVSLCCQVWAASDFFPLSRC